MLYLVGFMLEIFSFQLQGCRDICLEGEMEVGEHGKGD